MKRIVALEQQCLLESDYDGSCEYQFDFPCEYVSAAARGEILLQECFKGSGVKQ